MKIDISNWDNYEKVERILEKYHKDDISELLRMKVEVTNYDDENCFENLTKKMISTDKIAEFEKEDLCKYILYSFYHIFFERKTIFKGNTETTVTRFRELEENNLFESVFATYLELFKLGEACGNAIGQNLFQIFNDIKKLYNLPSMNKDEEYKVPCNECMGYGYIDLTICSHCSGEGATFFIDYDLDEYYKKLYKYEVKILSFNKEEVKKCFINIIKHMFDNSINYHKPKCELLREDKNVFNLLTIAIRTLQNAGLYAVIPDLYEAISAASSYEEALIIFRKYIDLY